jgi:hypothetical protein
MYNNNSLSTTRIDQIQNMKMTDKQSTISLSVTPAMPMCSQTRHQGGTVLWGNRTVISNPTRSANCITANFLSRDATVAKIYTLCGALTLDL